MGRLVGMAGVAIALVLLVTGCGTGSAARPTTSLAPTTSSGRLSIPPASAMSGGVTPPPIAIPRTTPVGRGALQPGGSPVVALITAVNALQQFPTGYQQSLVLYATIDRPNDDGGTVRDAYITPAALPAFRKNDTLPAGTVIVMDQFAARRDAQGQLLHDPQGRLIPGQAELVAVRVKLAPDQTVPGDRLPPGLRNGSWVYATFDPLSRQRDSLDNTVCSACHLQAADWDYLFTRPELMAAIQQNLPQLNRCDLAGRQPCQVPGQ